MTDRDVAAIDAVRQALQAAENAGDAEAAAALLTDDAVAMVPDFPVQEGREACAGFLREIMGWLTAHFERRVEYVSAEVAVIGDLAFDRGTFAFTTTPRDGGATARTTGKYFWLLRRTPDRAWRVARLIVSRDESCDDNEEAAAGDAVPGHSVPL